MRLRLEVDVLRTARVLARDDRLETVVALVIGELMAAQPIAGIVVAARRVGLPEIEHRLRDGGARAGQHPTGEDELRPGHRRFEQRASLRGSGLEVRPYRLGRR